MALHQSLQQKLLQKLSPQQIQLMKLLQVPTAILDDRIKEEMEENPALEQSEEGHEDEFDKDEFETATNEDDFEKDGSAEDYENIDISDYVHDGDDDIGDYRLKDDNYPEADDSRVIPHKVETSFIEMMLQQLGMLKLSDHQQKVAEQIVGSLDDDGYLRREIGSIIDDLAFRQNIETDPEEISDLLLQIQQFDPSGVGARSLQECLILQLERKLDQKQPVELALKVMEKYFNEFTKKHYEKIQRGLDITDDQLREIIQQIVRLNPKPGGNAGDENKNNNYVIPDFFIVNNNGKLELSLNSKNAPDLRISQGYREMLKDYDKGTKKDKRQKEAVLFIKQKIDSAKWFIDAIKQRQNTLLNTMEAIMNYQQLFFLSGDDTDLREWPLGTCHLMWRRMKDRLAAEGITWYSLADMNPGHHFD